MNYSKLMEHNPTEYQRIINSLGQEIVFYEHPLRGDEFPVIIVCHELKLADYTDFMECDDMVADHKEYEPTFVNGKLFIGGYEN
jgi:hypothetical protein